MESGLPIENYGKHEQKEWLDNIVTVPDLHPCTAGNKEEKHTCIFSYQTVFKFHV